MRQAVPFVLLVLATPAFAEEPRTVRGEVIEIHDRPAVQAKPRQDPALTPPYSDDAILSDTWSRAWVLLDVDEHGAVQHIKLLKKPGHGLDEIAVREAFARTFEPARDARGRAQGTWLVLKLEWPSYWWMIDHQGTTARVPPLTHPDPTHVQLAYIPCAGSGPLHMGSLHPAYRDCSQPDMSKINSLPWIARR
jgi:hypothetical protein